MEIKEAIYHDYLIIKNMKSSMFAKSRSLSHIICEWKDYWKVIGITKEALKIFSKNDFKSKSRLGIQRAHITQDRIVTNEYLLTNDLSFDEFWSYLIENDKTVLATSSENKRNDFGEIIKIDENLDLFSARGFGWKHNKTEIEFLTKLWIKEEEIL
jgi:hypothetical protein